MAEEAERWGAQLIVAHHPVIFHPARQITDGTSTGRVLLRLIEGGVAAVCAHTDLDAAQDGVNECLARALGLTEMEQLHQDGVDRNSQAPTAWAGWAAAPGRVLRTEYARLVKGRPGCSRGAFYRRRPSGVPGGSGRRLLRLYAGGRRRSGGATPLSPPT